jgi:hypothetical protein
VRYVQVRGYLKSLGSSLESPPPSHPAMLSPEHYRGLLSIIRVATGQGVMPKDQTLPSLPFGTAIIVISKYVVG